MSHIVRPALIALFLSGSAMVTAAACDTPDRDVMVQRQATPDLSSVPQLQHLVTTVIDVTVASSGKATAFRLDTSSGNTDFDNAVLEAAKESTYLPKIVNCQPVSAEFLFHLSFDPSH